MYLVGMANMIPHPKCGKTFPSNNRHGHCASCCETYVGLAAFDAHRRGHFEARECVNQPYESVGESAKTRYGHWLDSDGYWHYGKKLSTEERQEIWGTK